MNPAPSFDPLARAYHWMELATFGPWLMRARNTFLSNLASHPPARALVLGDGDGRFTALLLAALPAVEIDAVDASPAMLAELTRRARPHTARVHAHPADARQFTPPRLPYDLIATHFFLDCLTTEEVFALAVRIRAVAAPGALWIISEFAIPSGIGGSLLARPVVWGLYRAFALFTGLQVRSLPDHASALTAVGFVCREERLWLGGLLVSQCWMGPERAG